MTNVSLSRPLAWAFAITLASVAAGLTPKSSWHFASAADALASSGATSMPASAAGTSPNAVSAE